MHLFRLERVGIIRLLDILLKNVSSFFKGAWVGGWLVFCVIVFFLNEKFMRIFLKSGSFEF